MNPDLRQLRLPWFELMTVAGSGEIIGVGLLALSSASSSFPWLIALITPSSGGSHRCYFLTRSRKDAKKGQTKQIFKRSFSSPSSFRLGVFA
jgi:hypothetical protein